MNKVLNGILLGFFILVSVVFYLPNQAIASVAGLIDYSASPMVQLGVNSTNGSAGIYIGIKDIKDPSGTLAPTVNLAGYQIEVTYDSVRVSVLDIVYQTNMGTFSFNVDQNLGKVQIEADNVYQGINNYDKLVFVPLSLIGSANEVTPITIKFVEARDADLNVIHIPDEVNLTFQRGKVFNDPTTSMVGISDAVAGLQYLAQMQSEGFEDNQVNIVNMASILSPDVGEYGLKPNVKDIIALLQYIVELRNDYFQVVDIDSVTNAVILAENSVTQAAVDIARAQVDLLPDGAIKQSLTARLSFVQEIIWATTIPITVQPVTDLIATSTDTHPDSSRGVVNTLKWADSVTADVEIYRVFRSEVDNINSASVSSWVDPGQETYIDYEVEQGKTYYYFVKAYLGGNESLVTSAEVKTFDDSLIVVQPVTNLIVTSTDTDPDHPRGVINTIKWTDSVTAGVDYYEVFRSNNDSELSLAMVYPNVQIYLDDDVEPGKTYYYFVRAYFGGMEPVVASAEVQTDNDSFRVIQPVTNLSIISIDNEPDYLGGVVNTINWNDSATADVEYYEVFRSNNEGINILATVYPGEQTYTDYEVEPGIAYSYSVKAYLSGMEPVVASAEVQTLNDSFIVIEPVTSLIVTSTNNHPVKPGGVVNIINWTDSVTYGVESYKIFRSEVNDIDLASGSTSVEPGVQTYLDFYVEPGKTYYYFVKAYLAGNESVVLSAVVRT